MKNPLLSIVIPVYNSENYLDECIGSVLAQDFTDFELILVEDGSPDGSGAICDRYAAAHPGRVKVIHKENGGAASARNAGLRIAAGRYVGFVDSDDTVPSDMFGALVRTITETGTDVVESFFDVKRRQPNPLLESESVTRLSGRDALAQMFRWNISTSLCTKLFRREVLDGLVMDEGHINEDFRYLCEVFLRDIGVSVLPRSFYKYRETTGSVTRTMSEKYFDIFRNLDYISTLVPSDDRELRRLFEAYSMSMHIMSGVRIVRSRMNTKYKRWLRKNRRYILGHPRTLFGGPGLSMRWRLKAAFAFLRLP